MSNILISNWLKAVCDNGVILGLNFVTAGMGGTLEHLFATVGLG
jgi:hypothetical protein